MNDYPWHQMDAAEVLRQLGASVDHGLSDAEAQQKLRQAGANELEPGRRVSPWTILGEQIKNVLVIILLIAAGLSAFLGQGLEVIAIAVIVLFAVVLGFAQEYRAERAIEALRQMAAPLAAVLRNGEERTVPARELVPGDIVLLRAGDKIPADLRLIQVANLKVEEAALTGESLSVEKHTAPLAGGDVALGDRKNMAYAGTAVTYGRGRGVVVATAMNTEFGKIARLLQTVETSKTPLQQNLDKVGRTLAQAAIGVIVMIVVLALFRGQALLEMLVFGVALAVAVVPEALPAVVTISLAIGAQRMVKRNALIRRLSAVETLGSVSVICSDKTGTLTKDEMTVRQIFIAGQMLKVTGSGYEPKGEFVRDGNPVDE
jgi:Ca2+-transporting ATPase